MFWYLYVLVFLKADFLSLNIDACRLYLSNSSLNIAFYTLKKGSDKHIYITIYSFARELSQIEYEGCLINCMYAYVFVCMKYLLLQSIYL